LKSKEIEKKTKGIRQMFGNQKNQIEKKKKKKILKRII
jgi:hypothetical protein